MFHFTLDPDTTPNRFQRLVTDFYHDLGPELKSALTESLHLEPSQRPSLVTLRQLLEEQLRTYLSKARVEGSSE